MAVPLSRRQLLARPLLAAHLHQLLHPGLPVVADHPHPLAAPLSRRQLLPQRLLAARLRLRLRLDQSSSSRPFRSRSRVGR
ncbi:MAG: hypothetical protein WA797_02760 [Acidimicrobiales bacterium]